MELSNSDPDLHEWEKIRAVKGGDAVHDLEVTEIGFFFLILLSQIG